MKKLMMIFMVVAAFNSTASFADVESVADAELKSYRNVPLGYMLEYSAPFFLMKADGDTDDTKPPVLLNPFTEDLLQIHLLKNLNTNALPIRQFVETNAQKPYPPEATNISAEVNESGTKYLIKFKHANLYNTAIFTSFNATDVMYLVFQSKRSYAIPAELEKTISSIKNIQQ